MKILRLFSLSALFLAGIAGAEAAQQAQDLAYCCQHNTADSQCTFKTTVGCTCTYKEQSDGSSTLLCSGPSSDMDECEATYCPTSKASLRK
jgi:hypothetical protein